MQKKATEEAVKEACDRLVSEGRGVTGRAVKKEVGGTLETIYPYIDSWKAENSKDKAVVTDIPADVQKVIHMALERRSQEATTELGTLMAEANGRLNEVLEELAERNIMNTTLESALSASQTLYVELQQLCNKESAVDAETISGLRAQLDKTEKEKMELIHSAEAARMETGKMQLLIERADLVVTKSGEKILELEKQVAVTEKLLVEAEKSFAVAECHTQDLSTQITKFSNHLSNAEAAKAKLESEKSELINNLTANVAALNKTEGIAEQMALRIQDSAAASELQHTELQTVRKDAAHNVEQMNSRILVSEATVNQLRKDLESTRMELVAAQHVADTSATQVKMLMAEPKMQPDDNDNHIEKAQ